MKKNDLNKLLEVLAKKLTKKEYDLATYVILASRNSVEFGYRYNEQFLDEAQNSTHSQMKMFLTRMGKNAKFMITGDPGQIDLPRRMISGLKEALLILKNTNGIGIVSVSYTHLTLPTTTSV